MQHRAQLTEGPVGRTLLRLAVPMLGGTFAITAFNLADAYFVSKLGTLELAAMGFTFPVVMVIGGVAMGLGMGAASVISRAIGEGDHHRVKGLTTDSLVLAFLVVGVFSMVGLLTIGPLFRLLGASEQVLPLIREYMTIWYASVAFLILPMLGNNIIRAAGNTVFPSLIMIAAALINVVLDPLLIFGLYGFPRLGLTGAAVATALSRGLTLIAALSVLHFRFHMLDPSRSSLAAMWESWRKVLHIGVPTALTNLLAPLSIGLITRLVASFGEHAVAAFGAGARIERFAFMVPMALGVSQVPFIGQNWGAGRPDRVALCRRYSNRFALLWGVVCLAAFLLSGGWIARQFSQDTRVVDALALYLWILPLGYGMQEVHRYASFAFNAIGEPSRSVALNVLRVVVFVLPGAFIGARLGGLTGLFCGIALAQVAAGSIALRWAHRRFDVAEAAAGPVPSDPVGTP